MHYRRSGCVIAALLLGPPAAASAAQDPEAGTRDQPGPLAPPGATTAVADSLEMDVFEVRASRLRPRTRSQRVELTERDLDVEDVTAADDVGRLLPAARVGVNSRGEAVLQMRAAPERHVRVLVDDIPLVLPWDERVDLSMIPLDAIGTVDAERGMSSVLNGPNALAGVVRLRTRDVDLGGQRTRLAVRVGEAEAFQAQALHVRRRGGWNLLGAGSWRRRGATLVPSEFVGSLHQHPGRSRTNSDLEQTTFLARLGRGVGQGGSLRLLLHGTDGEKGVSPEAHRPDARFWRYPRLQRLLAGLSLRASLGRDWQLRASASADFARVDIREFDDATYSMPDLAPGVDYEEGRDRTVTARLLVHRPVGSRSSLALASDFRTTRHRERLTVDGPELRYAQTLASWTAQWHRYLSSSLDLVVGGGYEIAATPQTGDKPGQDATTAPVLQTGFTWRLDGRSQVRASISRRSRFPSLREQFSGALGRFVPNPDLRPERQDLIEASVEGHGARVAGAVGWFASWLDGSIERVALEDRRFQRRNLDSIRTWGVELHAAGRIFGRLEAQLHHTFLFARAEENGAYTGLVEDRPDYLSRAALAWVEPTGLGLRLEAQVTGLRHSADVNDTFDGLRALPPSVTWHARVFYETLPAGAVSSVEVFLRVDNLFDQRVDSQTGLPEPGRTAQAGLRVSLGDG